MSAMTGTTKTLFLYGRWLLVSVRTRLRLFPTRLDTSPIGKNYNVLNYMKYEI